MPGHLKDGLVTHLSLLAVNHKKQQEETEAFKAESKDEIEALKAKNKQQQDEIEALKKEVSQLKAQCHAVTVFPIDFVVKNPYQYNSTSVWTSKHFYSHCSGYKLNITFYVNPFCGYLLKSHIMQGEFDSQLKWPMKADINMLILHKHGEDLEFTISAKHKVPITGGHSHCCGQWSCGKSRDMNKYLHDNCLRFRITSIMLF